MQADEPCTAVFSGGSAPALAALRADIARASASASQTQPREAGAAAAAGTMVANAFDDKTDASSSSMYFHYYGMLQHQQNMLQDATRTGTYYWAMVGNCGDFSGKVVVDVGAGSGILSLFAAQVRVRRSVETVLLLLLLLRLALPCQEPHHAHTALRIQGH